MKRFGYAVRDVTVMASESLSMLGVADLCFAVSIRVRYDKGFCGRQVKHLNRRRGGEQIYLSVHAGV
jgi:hypothetical protein